MKSQLLKITLRPPLPKTAEGLRQRIAELLEARKAIDAELRDIYGTEVYREAGTEQVTCMRCGYKWYPRRALVKPDRCVICKSPYWNRPTEMGSDSYPRRRTRKIQRRTLPAVFPALPENVALTPPPAAPSLRERLTEARTWPAAEAEEQPERQASEKEPTQPC